MRVLLSHQLCLVLILRRICRWAKSRDPNSLVHVKELFRRQRDMFTKHGQQEARPNDISYIILIETFCLFGKPDEAEDALRQIYKDACQSFPNLDTWNTNANKVLDCWSKLNRHDSAERAESLLEWMIEKYQETQFGFLLPDEYSFSPGACFQTLYFWFSLFPPVRLIL